MPMLATLHRHDNGIATSFVVLASHEARHYFVGTIASGCNSDAMQARDGTFAGAATTIGSEGSTSITSDSIFSTGGIDLE